MHLIDLVGGVVIPIVLFLFLLTAPKWAPRALAIVNDFFAVLSSWVAVPERATNDAEHRSYATEQEREHMGTGEAEHVPELAEQLATLDDDELLEVLALVESEDGYRFAESRIGRFVGGRLEDRIDQVRAVRGVEASPIPRGRQLRVRDERGERVIPLR